MPPAITCGRPSPQLGQWCAGCTPGAAACALAPLHGSPSSVLWGRPGRGKSMTQNTCKRTGRIIWFLNIHACMSLSCNHRTSLLNFGSSFACVPGFSFLVCQWWRMSVCCEWVFVHPLAAFLKQVRLFFCGRKLAEFPVLLLRRTQGPLV